MNPAETGPFFLPGGSTGCLLIHGFTATPLAMRWLGDQLGAEGYTISGIRLPGHATSAEDLAQVNWQEWVEAAERGFKKLADQCSRVIVVGHSTGGALGLTLASRFALDGIVGLSTLHRLPREPFPGPLRNLPPGVRFWIMQLIGRIQPNIRKGKSDFFDKDAEEMHVSYSYFPVRAVVELARFLNENDKILEKVHSPLLLIHSLNDRFIPLSQAEYIFERVSSPDKTIETVEFCNHNVMLDSEKQRVLDHTLNFIQAHSVGTKSDFAGVTPEVT